MLINSKKDLLPLKEPIQFLTEPEIMEKKDELVEFVRQMESYLESEPDAAAIAAPQLGIKAPIISLKDKGKITSMINPILLDIDKQDIYYSQEGCMSLRFFGKNGNTGINVFAIRSKKLTVSYYHINHRGEIKRANNYNAADKILPSGEIVSRMATTIQHELNHLHGSILLDQAVPLDLIIKDDERFKDFTKVYRVFFFEEGSPMKSDYLVENEDITLYYNKNIKDLQMITPPENSEITEETPILEKIEKHLVGFFKENEENEEN